MPDEPAINPDEPLPEADDRLMEAALAQLLLPEVEGWRRIEGVMAAVQQPDPVSRAQSGWAHSRVSRRTWTRLAVAAAFLVSVGVLWPSAGGGSAQATVMRTLEVARARVARRYTTVKQSRRPLVGEFTLEQDLYVLGSDRFAVRRSARLLPGRDVWFGCNGESCWVVPPVGPRLEGDRQMLDGWLAPAQRASQDDREILHIATVLQWMSDEYELTSLEDQTLPDQTGLREQVRCRHVRGLLAGDKPSLPAQIDVWADRDSGVARRVVLDWRLDEADFGPSKLTLELVELPELPEDWFDANGH